MRTASRSLYIWRSHAYSDISVEVKDISLTDYIQIRHAVYLPHTAGRYAKKQFKKAQMPIVERLVDRWVSLHLLQGFVKVANYVLCVLKA